MAVTQTNSEAFNAERQVATITLAAADTLTPDMAVADTYLVTMPAGNITVANPANPKAGQRLVLSVTQDGVGSRTITWGANIKKNITLTTTAGATDLIEFVYDGTNWQMVASSKANA